MIAEPPPPTLDALAETVGVTRYWRDVDGRDQRVDDASLRAVLAALGYAADDDAAISASLSHVAARRNVPPPMIVTETGIATPIAVEAEHAEITGEDGVTRRVAMSNGQLAPIHAAGYYDLVAGALTTRLAVAPPRCPSPPPSPQRAWGTSLQISALRGPVPRAYGGLGELADAVRTLAAAGASAIAINPVHALFPGWGENFSPYSPSSRIHLNGALADPALAGLPPLPPHDGGDYIDWAGAVPQRLADLRSAYASLPDADRARIAAAIAADPVDVAHHALFDALDCHFRPQGARGWRDWPTAYHHADGPAALKFADEHADEVAFHAFVQWLTRQGLDAVQTAAQDAGMATGLIGDLAVGVHPGGSDSWAMPAAMLQGLSIGAPPDPLGPRGQNWALSGFSPDGLRDAGYAPWIDMLRAALRSAGGLRIDHAFGLARLWVIPSGGETRDGAYIEYPFLDLVRLVALEAHRAQALIIAEDLGTAPSGFTHAVTARHMLGMRVLWFERAHDSGFIGPQDYPPNAAAMTGTHDTPTVAGWWSGTDIDWADKLDRLPLGSDRAAAESLRDWDRGLLWATIGHGADRPAPDNPSPVVDAALAHIAATPAAIAIAPVEDLLAAREQPNLPGTTYEHPNWQRRLPAPLDELIADPVIAARMQRLSNGG